MFKRILVAYDGSEGAAAALKMGIGLAKNPGTDLSSISVEEHLPRYAASMSEVEGAREQIDEHFRALTKQARDSAALQGVELETAVRQGHEIESILDFARSRRCDLLILGSHGHSRVLERVIGSTSLSLVRLASCSVLIIGSRPGADSLTGIKRILVGVDGSPLGRLAFRFAVDFAILCGASIIGITIREISPLARAEEAESSYITQLKAAAEEHARAAGVTFEHVTRLGHAAQAIREQARDAGVDLIVLGATGLEHPWSGTIGGTASHVASETPCSVLLVRSPRALLHVEDIMVRAVSSVSVEAPLAEVVELLLRRNVKALPVLDARRHVVGIITGGDLLDRADMGLRLSIKQELDADALRERVHALTQSPKFARDVMTRHVHTVEGSADLAAVIRLMAAHRVKRLPVVNQHRELVGIVSRADVLRAIAALPQPNEAAEHEMAAAGRTVADAATTEVPVLPAEAPAEEVLERVVESPLRRVVVTSSTGTVLGLISDRDLLARSSPETRPWILRMLMGTGARKEGKRGSEHAGALRAADLMAPSLITVRPEDSLAHAIRLMMQHRVKRLVVVDEAGRFRGLVDRREILRLLAGESR
ncbi:MAG TPA: universal stress protein [Candidatus Methylomirabilis sp.]|nr:universal stress protein [Candidatus Methylomirabilis sp.]